MFLYEFISCDYFFWVQQICNENVFIIILKHPATIYLHIESLTMVHFDVWLNNKINKNLKFKKGVGIAIKSKETSSKLAI